MKRLLVPTLIGIASVIVLTGCVNIQTGQKATVGQQMMDLHLCKAANLITDAEYEAQKAKILGEK
jgi:hypothetical protein